MRITQRLSPVLRTLPTLGLCGLLGVLWMGCTTIGPMPGITGAGYAPEPRAGAELSFGVVPGYHVSEATRQEGDDSKGGFLELGGFFDPGELLGKASGLGVGLRWVPDAALYMEPMLRYRAYVDDDKRIALGGVLYGTHASGTEKGATLNMTRFGLEVAIDARVTPVNRWAELHVSGGFSVTGLLADGSYCQDDATGFGRDCDDDEPTNTSADVSGAYPAGFLSISAELFRGVPVFHRLTIAAYVAGGSMPRVTFGQQEDSRAWVGWGLNLTAGLGAW